MRSDSEQDEVHSSELWILLRYGVRQTLRLADRMAADGIGGEQVLGFQKRLLAIRTELDQAPSGGGIRQAMNDPIWTEPGPYLQRRERN